MGNIEVYKTESWSLFRIPHPTFKVQILIIVEYISFRFHIILIIFIIKYLNTSVFALCTLFWLQHACLPHFSIITLFCSYFHVYLPLHTYPIVYWNCLQEVELLGQIFTIFCQNVFPKDLRVVVFLTVLMFDISSFLSFCQSGSMTYFSRLIITIKMKII